MSTGELPAVIPVEVFLATSSTATFDLSAIYVYSDHCVFDVSWALRRTRQSQEAWFEHFTNPNNQVFVGSSFDSPSPDAQFGRLRCTAQLADGRVLPDFGAGSAGSTSTADGTAYPVLEPLPPPGELRITLDWPEFGIHNAVTVLDATAINQAARRVRRL